MVAHSCNPIYSGGRDQEDRVSKPAQANSLWDPIQKIPITKRTGGAAQGEGAEFKPQHWKKKNCNNFSWKRIFVNRLHNIFLNK
jgi:hypothetical protein